MGEGEIVGAFWSLMDELYKNTNESFKNQVHLEKQLCHSCATQAQGPEFGFPAPLEKPRARHTSETPAGQRQEELWGPLPSEISRLQLQ